MKKNQYDSMDLLDYLQFSIMIICIIIIVYAIFVFNFTLNKDKGVPEYLDYLCNNFSEQYNQFFEHEDDLTSISPEKAYRSKASLDAQSKEYHYYLDYWSTPNKKAQEEISSDAKAKIVLNHVYNKSCEPYWKYTEVLRPTLIENLKKSKK